MVESDHSPLVSITLKPLDKASARLQRMLQRLQHYDIELLYKPRKELYSADKLSRAHPPTTSDDDKDLSLSVHSASANLPVSDRKLAELRRETANNNALVKLAETIQQGWPNYKQKALIQIRKYRTFRDTLVLTDDLILKGQAIVVP